MNPVKEYIMTYFPASDAALARLNEIVDIVHGDDVAVSLLDKVFESGERYFSLVCEMERKLKVARLRLEGEELRELTTNLDQNRKLAHNALIDNLHIFNRYIIRQFEGEIPTGGIFSKDPESIRDRVAVADWIGEVLCSLYVNRKR